MLAHERHIDAGQAHAVYAHTAHAHAPHANIMHACILYAHASMQCMFFVRINNHMPPIAASQSLFTISMSNRFSRVLLSRAKTTEIVDVVYVNNVM